MAIDEDLQCLGSATAQCFGIITRQLLFADVRNDGMRSDLQARRMQTQSTPGITSIFNDTVHVESQRHVPNGCNRVLFPSQNEHWGRNCLSYFK